MLENPEYPVVLASIVEAVTIHGCGQSAGKTGSDTWMNQNPQRPYARRLLITPMETKRWSGLYGDMQSAAEMTAPPSELAVVTMTNGPKVSASLP